MTIAERQNRIIDEFKDISSWEDRYKKLIERGKKLESLPEELKTEESLVKGCQSQVWLHAHMEQDQMILRADSDALLVKGLVSLLLEVFSKANPQDVLKSDLKFIEEIGLGTHLTPSRANGLFSMVKQIKYFAAAFEMLKNR